MSYYEHDQLSAEEYEDVIDGLEMEIDELKKERENLLSDVEFMESKLHTENITILDLKFEIEKLLSNNKELKENLQRLSSDKFFTSEVKERNRRYVRQS